MSRPRCHEHADRAIAARFAFAGLLAAMLLPSPGSTAEVAAADVVRLETRVLAEYDHDPDAFTQGLLWHDGSLFESTGQYGESTLRRVDLGSGAVQQRASLPDELFGEGLARVGERLVQLTWREGTALVWDLETFDRRGEFSFSGEGWGLCHVAGTLFMSDGTSRLTLRDAETFEILGGLTVTLSGRAVAGLNELECAEGWVYANVYGSDLIARIDPSSGTISAVIDASNLYASPERSSAAVLNGIAYLPERGTFALTGKNWPRLFEVVFAGVSAPAGVTEP